MCVFSKRFRSVRRADVPLPYFVHRGRTTRTLRPTPRTPRTRSPSYTPTHSPTSSRPPPTSRATKTTSTQRLPVRRRGGRRRRRRRSGLMRLLMR